MYVDFEFAICALSKRTRLFGRQGKRNRNIATERTSKKSIMIGKTRKGGTNKEKNVLIIRKKEEREKN